MNKKRILYICSEAAAGMIPFAANIIHAAAQSQQLEVFVLAVDDDKLSYRPYFTHFRKEHAYFLNTPKNKVNKHLCKLYAGYILQKTKEICSLHSIDIIHLLTGDYTCHSIVSKLQRLADVYYTVHDLHPHEKVLKNLKERVFYNYLQYGVKHTIKQIDNLVTCSKIQYDAIKKLYPNKTIHYHPFPSLITESIRNGTAVCPELSEWKDYILFFGSIDQYKGVDLLYKTFRENRHLSGNQLVIAGNGNIYFSHTDDPRILFINRYIKDEEVALLFRRAACVVYPYISATQSGVLTLAYKFQTPVLASDLPFFKETSTEQSCLFFKPADVADLSDKLEKLLFSTDLNRMKTAQKEFYERCSSQKALTTSIESIY